MTPHRRTEARPRRAAGPMMLGWSLLCGGLGAGVVIAASWLAHVDMTSVLVGVGLALGLAVAGLALVSPLARTGHMAFVLVMTLYAGQVLAMFAIAGSLRGRDWIHPMPLAFAALITALCWQSGVTVGFLRARTPVLVGSGVRG